MIDVIRSAFVRDFIARARTRCYDLADRRAVYLNRQDELIASTTVEALRVFTDEEAAEFDQLTANIQWIDHQIDDLNAKIQHYVVADKKTWSELNHLDQELRATAIAAKPQKPKVQPKKADVEFKPVEPCRCWQCSGDPEPVINDSPSLPVAIVSEGDLKEIRPHYFADDLDRQARALQNWSPWGRYHRAQSLKSRRYEGFRRTRTA